MDYVQYLHEENDKLVRTTKALEKKNDRLGALAKELEREAGNYRNQYQETQIKLDAALWYVFMVQQEDDALRRVWKSDEGVEASCDLSMIEKSPQAEIYTKQTILERKEQQIRERKAIRKEQLVSDMRWDGDPRR